MIVQANLRGVRWPLVAMAAALLACAPLIARAALPPLSVSTTLLADANKRFSISGVVRSVSYQTNTVRLSGDGQSVTIEITPTTAIEVCGEAGSIADIRRGSKITATGVIRDGAWVANSVVVH
jgi:hypothetical protein